MKIRTITKGTIEAFDEAVSKASEELNGKFTQTHVTQLNTGLVYTAVIFYE